MKRKADDLKNRLKKTIASHNDSEEVANAFIQLSQQLGEARGYATGLRDQFCPELKLPWEGEQNT